MDVVVYGNSGLTLHQYKDQCQDVPSLVLQMKELCLEGTRKLSATQEHIESSVMLIANEQRQSTVLD